MAIYTYRCAHCDRRAEVVQSIKSYCVAPEVPDCPACVWVDKSPGPVKMERYLTPPLIMFDTAPWGAYQSPIDGSTITSRAQRNEHMVKHGVVPFEEVAPDFARKRKENQKQATAELKADLIDATHRVEAGYVPTVESVDNFVPAAA